MSTTTKTGRLELEEEPLEEIYGGTHQTTLTTGDTLYASTLNTFSKLPIGASGSVYTSNGTIPGWGAAGTVAIAYPDAIIDSNETTGGIVYADIASAIAAGAANICIRSNHTEPAVALALTRNTAIRINASRTLTLPATGAAITGSFDLTLEGEGTVDFTGAGAISITTTNTYISGITISGTTLTFASPGTIYAINCIFNNTARFTFGDDTTTLGLILIDTKFTTQGSIGSTAPFIQVRGMVNIYSLTSTSNGYQNLEFGGTDKLDSTLIANSRFNTLSSNTGDMQIINNDIVSLSFSASVSACQISNNAIGTFSIAGDFIQGTISNNTFATSCTFTGTSTANNWTFVGNTLLGTFTQTGNAARVAISSNHFEGAISIGNIDDLIFSNNICNSTTTFTVTAVSSNNVAIISNQFDNTVNITSSGVAFIDNWTIEGNSIDGALTLTTISVNQNSVIIGNTFSSFSSTPSLDNSVFANNVVNNGNIAFSSTLTDSIISNNVLVTGSITFAGNISDSIISDNKVDAAITQTVGAISRCTIDSNYVGTTMTFGVSASTDDTIGQNRVNGAITISAALSNTTISDNRASNIAISGNLTDSTIVGNTCTSSTIAITGNTSNSILNANVARGGLSTGTTSNNNIVTSNRNGGLTTGFLAPDVIANNL